VSELVSKIMSNDTLLIEDLEEEELEQLEVSLEAQAAFNNRWYRTDNPDTYFVLVNMEERTIKAGEQVFFQYAEKSNSYLLEK
jgi:hypothetical protein